MAKKTNITLKKLWYFHDGHSPLCSEGGYKHPEYKALIQLFNATTVTLTLLSPLCEAKKRNTDLDHKNRFSAKSGHVNHGSRSHTM